MPSGNHLSLPPEIRYQILTKLPVKSVLRFRSVCKTWQSLVSGPNFISDHGYKRVLVSRYDGVTNLFKFSSHDESFVESHALEHDGIGGNIVGSCNGLICLWEGKYGDAYLQRFLIWNPSIKKIVKLPSNASEYSSEALDQRERDCLYGFGFDPIDSDYKVLCFQSKVHDDDDDDDLECQIFSLRKGVWRSLITPTLPNFVEKCRSFVYLNGFLHWIGYDGDKNCVLLSFNLSIEAFKEMEVPGDVDFEEVDFQSILCFSNVSLINGLLSVAVFRMPPLLDSPQGCSVWSMKEYGVTESWTKLYRIDLQFELSRWPFLGFLRNGELLIPNSKDRGQFHEAVLGLYNPKSRESRAILPLRYLKDVCFYDESFVLP